MKNWIPFLLMIVFWVLFFFVLTHADLYHAIPWLKYLELGSAAYWTGRYVGDFR